MGASASGMKAADQPAAESLLTAFKTLSAAERRRHASVLNYWLSVRGDKEFPPLHDLDPLELSDAGPSSILMELISGGHDAEIRHLGEALREEAWPERIIDAPNPSVLSCIAKKLPIVAISRDFLAFEDEYEAAAGKTRCSVTLLPLSAGGAWVDYVYALVSVEPISAKTKSVDTSKKAKATDQEVPGEPEHADLDEEVGTEAMAEPAASEISTEQPDENEPSAVSVAGKPIEQAAETKRPEELLDDHALAGLATEKSEPGHDGSPTAPASVPAKAAPGFSKLLDSLAGLTGFYGSHPVRVEAMVEPSEPAIEQEQGASPPQEAAVAEEIAKVVVDEVDTEASAEETLAEKPSHVTSEECAAPGILEGSLQNKLTQVRAKADEARMARLRANAALYEGLGAAYDFALDAEEAPEEYLRLVEAQGLKIQLRSPMKPVVKLAFAGMCDDPTIKQLEAVLAWAFDEELPRGTLAERIEAAGGIGGILNPEAKAA
ncbi:MAG TPA: hypothetical protein VGU01_09835 [Sphingomicrobium sp.]|nr:hypothetical protein [Sphingomicrobium sp.]